MSQAFENSVAERLTALERQNLRLRRGLTGLAILVLLQVLAAVGWLLLPPPVLKANKLVAVDCDGNPRVELDATEPSMAKVSLYDRHGRLQASLCENGGRSCLFFFYPDRDLDQLALCTGADGAELVVKDPAGSGPCCL